MITEVEAEKLMKRFISLRSRAAKSKKLKDVESLRRHQRICMEKFSYIIHMRTARYKSFPNYDDLNQEGFEALLKAMKNYNPKKSCFFYWAHKYIDTRIARSANLHTAIRFPLKYTRKFTPHRESTIPTMIEPYFNPETIVETEQIISIVKSSLDVLDERERAVVQLVFGFGDSRPLSINKICKQLHLSRPTCVRAIDSALSQLKEAIKL